MAHSELKSEFKKLLVMSIHTTIITLPLHTHTADKNRLRRRTQQSCFGYNSVIPHSASNLIIANLQASM